MAEQLQRLVNIEGFDSLQNILTKWLQNYQTNSSGKNLTRCCEAIELNSKIQSQLFRILGLTVAEGCLHDGANTIRTRLLPGLTQHYFTGTGLIRSQTDRCVELLNDALVTDQEMGRLQQNYHKSLQELESDLRISRTEADHLQDQLKGTRDKLNSIKDQTSNEKTVSETTARKMRQKLSLLADELSVMRSRGSSVELCDSDIRRWKEDLARKTCRNGHLSEWMCVDSYTPGTATARLSRQTVPFALHDTCQRLRQEHLIQRFLEMYSIDHQSALNSLSACIDSREERQRILFDVMQEVFTAAKLAFANYKTKVRSTVVFKNSGSLSQEEAVQDYIIRNPEDYNLTGLVLDVTGAVRQRRSNHPNNTSLGLIQPFIREACRLAWNMQALPHPIDIAPAASHEVYDNQRYRRYYSSECTAPLIEHHVWPSLVQGLKVIVKGEAYTMSPGESVTEVGERYSSPVPPLIPLTRSRSPSPIGPRSNFIGSTANRSRSPSPLKRQHTSSRVFEPRTSMTRIPLY